MPNRIDGPSTAPAFPVSTSTTALREGSRGEDVKRLQQALTAAGYDTGAPDGIFGRGTAAALKAFQEANGLTADGVAGQGVWDKLQSGNVNPPPPGGPTRRPVSNDQVLFVAVNNSENHLSTVESDALQGRGVNVTVIKDAATPDTIATKDSRGVVTTHDLTSPDGPRNFVLTLGLPAEQSQKIVDVIKKAGPDAKDEIANMAYRWSFAEKGGQAPSRLILSGHHVGYGVYGENNGRLEWPLIGDLAEAMPKAARSVEDLMIAGCYSGGERMMEKYQGFFPNVKTIVAYDGSSPGAYSGATAHQKVWEQATRGTRDDIDRHIFQGMRKGENVTVWTRSHGFQDGKPPKALDELRTDRTRHQAEFDSAWTGQTPITDTQQGPVRDFYSATQRLIQHPQLPQAERETLEALRDQTIRLIFYGVISQRFGDVYSVKINSGYQALGMTPPDFKTLSRKDALTAIKAFQDKLAATQPPPDAAVRLSPILRDYAELKPSVIPDTWI